MSNPNDPDDASKSASPFHEGETAVHERYGIGERIEQVGRAVIRPFMPAQHREFFRSQAMIFVGSLDSSRRPWASVIVGPPGFLDSKDDRTLRINARPAPGDPLDSNLVAGAPLGLLGIELATRRRNRMNGTVRECDDGGFTVSVDQSFGNCPQYIQAREGRWHGNPSELRDSREVEALDGRLGEIALSIVRRSDTMFLASAASSARGFAGPEGVDVSHRGGRPGFVRVTAPTADGANVLTIPDFRGNFLFNTLGNLSTHPLAGLLFVDFPSGDLLQLTGSTEIVWEGPEVEAFVGARRLVKVTVDRGWRHPGALPMRWSEPEYANQLAATGTWAEPTN